MKKFLTNCDMGSIKVSTGDVSLFFGNGIGDGGNVVEIEEGHQGLPAHSWEFIEHFTVKKDQTVYLCEYDCSDVPIHYFKKGRWFVYLKSPAHFVIAFCDGELHS